eukprot:m.186582 g.186582  ORF g.186582 m.186582 type:complete len:127 (+) comp14757_c0_seq5:181-561(+)
MSVQAGDDLVYDGATETKQHVSDNTVGFLLAVGSSLFIGASFVMKKKGLIRSRASGTAAGDGGFAYLREPLWWGGMLTSKLHSFKQPLPFPQFQLHQTRHHHLSIISQCPLWSWDKLLPHFREICV